MNLPSRARLVRTLAWIAGVTAAFILFGFLGLPPLLKWQLESRLTETLGRETTIERIAFNPFTLETTVQGFALRERGSDRAAFRCESLYVNFSARSLRYFAPVVEALTVTRPRLALARGKDGRYSLEDLWASLAQPPDSEPPRFALANLRLVDGAIEFDDRKTSGRHVVQGLAFDLPLLSNLEEHLDVFVQPRLAAVVNGASLKIEGQSKPFHGTRTSRLKLRLNDMEAKPYLAYLQPLLPVTVPSARLNTTLAFDFSIGSDGKPRLRVQGDAGIEGLALARREGGELLKVAKATFSKLDLNLHTRTLALGELRIESPALSLAREADGTLDLARLVPPSEAPPVVDTPPEPWTFRLGALALTGGSLRFEDRTRTPALTLGANAVGLTIEDFVNTPDHASRVKLDATLDSGGVLALGGTLGNDLKGRLDVTVTRAALPPFWVYAQPHVAAQLRQGALSARGTLELGHDAEAPLVAWQGEAELTDVDLKAEHRKADLARWKSLQLRGMELATNPPKVVIAEARLSDFYKRLLLDEEGRLNLLLLGRHGKTAVQDAPAPEGDQSGVPEWIEIGKLSLERGNVYFSDHFIKPNYNAHITHLEGSIGPLRNGRQATIALQGRVARTAPLTIEGQLDSFSKALFLDLHANASDIEMAALTPYSGRYLGYGIEKGRLSTQVHYKLERRTLTAENHITLDQLTFGAAVESKDATKLPVLFAVSLLKDGKGVIDVDMPVSGSLDDPKFSVSGIVLKLVFSLITKAVTAPFALLGSLVPGGGEELGYVEFAPGTATLDAAAEEKLAKLALVLGERPGLKMDISGRVDPAADEAGLRQHWLDGEIRRRHVERLKRKGQAPTDPEMVEVPTSDYPDLLEDVYEDADFERPRNAIGLLKTQPLEVMENMLREHAPIGTGALHELAEQRAQNTKQYLQDDGGVAAERLFLTAPKEGAGEGAESAAPTRVDFKLKG